jgi:hypothetical protein
MTEEENLKIINELTREVATLKEQVEILKKIVKTHEHDSRDGCIKFDVGYL